MFIQVNLEIPGASFTISLRNQSSLVCFCCYCFLWLVFVVIVRFSSSVVWSLVTRERHFRWQDSPFAVRSLHVTCAHASAWWSTCRASAMRRDTRAPLMNELRTCHHSRTAPFCFVFPLFRGENLGKLCAKHLLNQWTVFSVVTVFAQNMSTLTSLFKTPVCRGTKAGPGCAYGDKGWGLLTGCGGVSFAVDDHQSHGVASDELSANNEKKH